MRAPHDAAAGAADGTIGTVLERLSVRGLAIIDAVEIELAPGFVAITGETGAGKSLLVESLKLLTGQRARTDQVRSDADRLRVEGWFSALASPQLDAACHELGIECDGELVIRREVVAEGRSRCWLNDVPVTVTALQQIAPALLSIHGQHEQFGLAEPAVQRRLVDEYGGHATLLAEVAAAWHAWRTAAAALAELEAAQASRRDRLDAIAFQIAEIDAVAPQPGEDEALRQRRQLLRHAVRVMELTGATLARLAEDDGAAVAALARSERDLEEIAACGLAVGEAAARLAEARVVVEEVVRELQDLTAGVGEDPADLEQVEGRLHRLERLLLKYGADLAAVIDHRQSLATEQAALAGVGERLEDARREAATTLAAYDDVAHRLQAARVAAGEALVGEVATVLAELAMAGTRIELTWTAVGDPASPLERAGSAVAFGPDGVEECELQIAPNPGEPLRPMARIASGGELSRLHLALRTVLRRRAPSGGLTLLFDEVDSGLGGGTAAALARLLRRLAAADQVIVVTHLPQVAAGAASHHRIDKLVADRRTVTRVTTLDDAGRVEELARMLSGGRVTDAARSHARQLMAEA